MKGIEKQPISERDFIKLWTRFDRRILCRNKQGENVRKFFIKRPVHHKNGKVKYVLIDQYDM